MMKSLKVGIGFPANPDMSNCSHGNMETCDTLERIMSHLKLCKTQACKALGPSCSCIMDNSVEYLYSVF